MSNIELDRCKFCPFRRNLQDLKQTKKFCKDAALKLDNGKISVSFPCKERKVTFRDINEDVKNKYPKWNEVPIVVPNYDFCGIEDRLIWTEKDIKTSLKNMYEIKLEKCREAFSKLLDLPREEHTQYIKQELSNIFECKSNSELEKLHQKFMDIFDSEDKNAAFRTFCKKQINYYVNKSKIHSSFLKIKGDNLS